MKPVSVTVKGVGVSVPIAMDYYVGPFNVGFGVVPEVGVTYTVQHTFQDCLTPGFDPATAIWFDHPTAVTQTVKQDGNYAFPVSAIRLKVDAGANSATLTVIQAGVR